MTLRDTTALETGRLRLRRITEDDLDFYAAVHADPETAQYLAHGRPRPREETVVWLANVLKGYDELQLGPLAVERRSDGALLGRCGTSDMVIELQAGASAFPRAWFFRSTAETSEPFRYEVELGYTFARQYWGHGYATEAARAVSDYALKTRQLPRLISVIHADNRRSLGVARKFGLRFEDTVELGGRPFGRLVWPTPA
jgi:RimJ/RimL family protein N-acetyltransferase